MFPKPLGTSILIDPIYDPDKIGSIYMAPEVQNPLPSNGDVVDVGPNQDEIEMGFRVLVSTYGVDFTRFWTHPRTRHEYAIYHDHEVIAFLTNSAEVYPRRDAVIVKPLWNDPDEQGTGRIQLLTRVFSSPPPKLATVERVGSLVTSLKRGDTVLLPRTGGNELGVRDRVLYSLKEVDILGIVTNAIETDSTKPDRRRR